MENFKVNKNILTEFAEDNCISEDIAEKIINELYNADYISNCYDLKNISIWFDCNAKTVADYLINHYEEIGAIDELKKSHCTKLGYGLNLIDYIDWKKLSNDVNRHGEFIETEYGVVEIFE